MNKRALLLVTMVALLAMGVMVAASNAQSGSGTPSAPDVMKGEGTHSSDLSPASEFAGRWHHKHSLEAIQKKLGITDEQKKQIRALYVGFRDRTRKTRTELMAIKDEKKTMLLSGKIDQQKMAQLDDQTVKLVSDLLKEKLKLRRDRLALMTPEQLNKIADWQAERSFRSKMKKMHWGRGHGEGMRGGFGG